MAFMFQPSKRKIGNSIGLLSGSLALMLLVVLIAVTQLKETSSSIAKVLSTTVPISTTSTSTIVNTVDIKSSVTEDKIDADVHRTTLSSKANDIIQRRSPIDVPVDDSSQVNHGKDDVELVNETATVAMVDKKQFQRYSVVKSPAPITAHNSETKQNRTLVVVLGSVRGGEPTWRSLSQQVLDPNMADLAMVLGEGYPTESTTKVKPTLLHERAKYIWTVPEFDDWADAMEDIPNKPPDWRERLFGMTNTSNHLNIILGAANNIDGSGALVFMFRFYLSQIIVENNFVSMYDRFVVTRSDNYYLCLHDLAALSNDYLWVPTGSDYGGICDRHFIASNETVLSALDVLPPLVRSPANYKKELQAYSYNTERFLLLRWKQEGLKPRLRRFKRTLFVAAGSTDQTRWKGKEEYMEHLGVHLKYSTEYWESVRSCNESTDILTVPKVQL
jgi:hypothetical protein